METKTIKRFSVGMMLVAFVLMIAAAFGLPQSVFATTQAKENNVGETLQLTNVLDKYTVGADNYVVLPTATFASGELKVTAVTANSAKDSVEVGWNTATTPKLKFQNGVTDYLVTYTLTALNKVKTESVVKISLAPSQVVFDWDINTTKIIPAKINLKTNNEFTKINLPMPTVKNADGEELPTDGKLTVEMKDPDQTDISDQITSGVWTAKEGNKVGTYTVIYTYEDSNVQTKTQEFTFVLTKETIATQLQISGWKNSKTLPTSMALYVESELPQPAVVNTKASNADVDVYTLIYLQCVPSSTSDKATIYTNDESKKDTEGYTYCADLNNFKFTPTVAGKYTVTYVVQDFFGNTARQSSNSNAITAQKTKASGQAYIVDAYAGEDETTTKANYEKLVKDLEEEVLQTAESKIPSYVYTGYKFDFPAIFGYDKAYGNDSLTKLTYQIKVSYTETGKTSETTMNFSSSTSKTEGTANRHLDPENPTTNVNLKDFEFKYAVDYKIKYSVNDANNNSLFDNTYTVKVVESKPTTNISKLTIDGVNNNVKKGTTLKFTVSASSTLASDSSTTADARPTVEVKYSIGGNDETVILLHSDGYYYLDLSDSKFSNKQVTIIATATDDLEASKTISQTINVQDITSGQKAPEVKSNIIFDSSWNGLKLNEIQAGTELNLPFLAFYDDSSFSVSAKVFCNGKELATQTWLKKGEKETITIGGQSFTASKVGTYFVVYEAKDFSGNKATKSFTFTVVGKEIPIINVKAFASSYEYGDEIDISNIAVTINGDEVNSSFYSNIITNVPNTEAKVTEMIEAFVQGNNYTDLDTGIVYEHANYTIKGSILCLIEGNVASFDDAQDLKTTIRAGQEGSVTLTYWAVSESGQFNENPTSVTFSVSDTKGPIVTLNAKKITTQTYDEKKGGTVVYIPNATAKDYASGEYCDVTITAKYKADSSNLTITQDTTKPGYYGYVEATKSGVIEVTYSSKDSKGNSATVLSGEENESLTYTISVGDVSAPVIDATELQKYVDEQNYKKGSTVSLDLSKLSITKDLTYKSSNFTYSVTCAGETVSDTTLDDSTLSFTADSYGEYVVSFNVKDSSGTAADTKTVSFTIKKESSESTTSTTVWGTVLIIAVLVVLGVVIFLFAKPTKSKAKIKTDADKKDDKKDNNKKDKLEV